MRTLLLLLLIINLHADNYTYLVDKYDKDVDLEAKIINKIAKDILKESLISLYIPNMNSLDKKVYSTKFNLVENCQEASFVFVKYKDNLNECKTLKNKYLFTNNYKALIKNSRYLGAFFWSKSRPNIVFIKDRLTAKKLTLPKEYNQFIEDF